MHGESHNHHHGDELDEHPDPGRSTWNGFVELAGEWEGRQRIDGVVEAESGGKWAFVAPGIRYNAAVGWSASAALAVPVWQRIRRFAPRQSLPADFHHRPGALTAKMPCAFGTGISRRAQRRAADGKSAGSLDPSTEHGPSPHPYFLAARGAPGGQPARHRAGAEADSDVVVSDLILRRMPAAVGGRIQARRARRASGCSIAAWSRPKSAGRATTAPAHGCQLARDRCRCGAS